MTVLCKGFGMSEIDVGKPDRVTKAAIVDAISQVQQIQRVLAPLSLACEVVTDCLMELNAGKISKATAERAVEAVAALPAWDGAQIGERMMSALTIVAAHFGEELR